MDSTRINGAIYDGSSVELSIENVGTISGLQSINYGATKTVNKVYGAGNKAIGRTPGQDTPDDGSMEINLVEFNNWVAAAGSLDAFLYSVFDVTVNYRVNANSPLITVVLRDCTPVNYSAAHANGPDNLTVTVNFSVMEIV